MIDEYLKCVFEDSLSDSFISNELYERYNVKKGLRNSNGTGVLVLLTKVSDVYGYRIENGKKIDSLNGNGSHIPFHPANNNQNLLENLSQINGNHNYSTINNRPMSAKIRFNTKLLKK